MLSENLEGVTTKFFPGTLQLTPSHLHHLFKNSPETNPDKLCSNRNFQLKVCIVLEYTPKKMAAIA